MMSVVRVRQAAQAPVIEVGQQALDDVADADDEGHQPGGQRNPAELLAQIGSTDDRRFRRPLITGYGLCRSWPAWLCHLGHESQAPAHGASA
jgi:hypothetical protein